MKRTYLIKNGTIVDGTGSAPFKGDVRVANGIIASIGENLDRAPRERVIDATGCYVTPGFIEPHNHFDGPMWWMPTMEPMPGYGVTTSINGNCGFTAAPVSTDAAVRREMVDIFSFFEDIPQKPFLDQLPWDWNKWSEYKDSMQRNVKLPVNYAAFVGHVAIRLAVMGMDAWDREATPDEVKAMCAYLEDALQAGALGMSSNLLDYDSKGRPIPSLKADDAEWSALIAVIARHEGTSLQVIVDSFMRMTAPASIARITGLAKEKGIRVQFTGIPTLKFQEFLIPEFLKAHEERKAAGEDVHVGFSVVPITIVVNFLSSLVFSQSNNYVWNEIIDAKSEDAKFALLEDPEWRKRARESWDQTMSHSPMADVEHIELFESESGAGPTGVMLGNYTRDNGFPHHSDALAEWLLENGINSTLRLSDWAKSDEMISGLMHDPNAIGILTDAGAHGKMFCGIGDNVVLLTKYVRDTNEISIEQAVHIMTGKCATHFGLLDRGEIKAGKRADLVVFNIDEIERRKNKKVFDVPDGEGGRTYRYSRDPAPMRLTMVNGVPTFDDGAFTGHFPGEYIGPTVAYLAEAAE